MLMRKFTYFLVGILFLLVPWQDIGAQTSVYINEDFENVVSMPTGWNNAEGNFDQSPWTLYTNTNAWGVIPHQGTKCMKFDSYYNSKNTYNVLKTQSVSLPSTATDVRLSFYVLNISGGDFSVYVSTDGGVSYTNNLLESNITGVSEWTKKSYSLNQFIGQTVTIVFKATSNYGSHSEQSSVYLDEVKLYDVPTCAQPVDVNVVSTTQNNVKLSWALDNEGDTSSTFIFNVKDNTGATAKLDTCVVTSSMMHTISGLAPNTNYTVTVKTDCSAASRGYSAISEALSFTTLCTATTLPYSNNFDSENSIPSCWIINAPTSSTNVNSVTKYGTTGKSFSIQSTELSSALISTGQFNHPANDIQIDFMVYATADKTPITVGIMSDPYDISSFEPLFPLTIEKANTWKNIRVNTHATSYGNATGLSVGIQLSSGASRLIYIDNLSITQIPTCARPENIAVSALDSMTINVAWDAVGNSSNNFELEFTNLTDNTKAIYTATTNPAQISNLPFNTSYSVRVRAICSVGDTSEWSFPGEVSTLCGAYSIPFFENFDGSDSLPSCWNTYLTKEGTEGYGYVVEGWEIYTPRSVGDYYVRTGNAIQSPDSKRGTCYMLSLPPINIPQTGDYELNFWMRREETDVTTENITIYINNVPTKTGAVKLDSINRSLKVHPAESEGSKYYEYFYPITMRGVVYIMIESKHDYNGSIILDDISVDVKRDCRNGVYNIATAEDVDSYSVAMNWQTKTEETSWLLTIDAYDPSDEIVHQDTIVVNNTSYIFNLQQYLAPSTTYHLVFGISAICANGDTTEAKVKDIWFTTKCENATLPFFEGFESTTFPPVCWNALTDPNSQDISKAWELTNYSTASGQFSASFQDASAITIGYLSTPPMELKADSNYSFSYSIRRSSAYSGRLNEGITIWLSTVPGDTTNAVKLGFIPRLTNLTPVVNNDGWYTYSYVITPQTTNNYYFIIQATQQYGQPNYVDDIRVVKLSNCLSVLTSEVNVTPMFNTADVVVKNIEKEIEYVVCSKEDVVADSINASDVIYSKVISATDSTFVITGLNTSTTYNLYVRTICDRASNDVSDWTGPFTFSTLCEAPVIAIPNEYYDSFEDYADLSFLGADNTCYDVESTSTIYFKGSLGSHIGESGTQCAPHTGNTQLGVYYGTSGNISRPMYLYAGKNYEAMVYARIDNPSQYYLAEMALFYSPINVDTMIYMAKNLDANNGEWTKYSGYFNVPADGYYNVGFEFNQLLTYNSYMVFDDYRVREVDCIPPTMIEVLSTSPSSVTALMTSNATEWEIRICTEKPTDSDLNPSYIYRDTINSNQFTVNGLDGNSDFYLIARSICNGSVSDWSRPVKFSTDCVPVSIPYTTDFETDINSRCWRMVGSAESQMEPTTTNKKFGSKSLKVKGATIVSPEILADSLTGFMVTGWVYVNHTDTTSVASIGVDVCTDPNDVSSFENVTSFSTSNFNQWVEFTVYLDSISEDLIIDLGQPKYVALSCTGGDTYYFDDIIIAPRPTCFKPSNVVANVLDAHNVRLNFNSVGGETAWLVDIYKKGSGTQYNKVGDTIVNSTNAVITGLEPITNYYFTVKAICSATDTSFMSYSNSVKTPCAPLRLPYSANFEVGMPECWDIYTTPGSGINWNFYSYYGYVYSSSSYGAASDTAYFASPEFILRGSNGVEITVDGYQTSTTDTVNTYMRYTLDGGNTYTLLNESCVVKGSRGTKKITLPNVGPGTIQFEFISSKHITTNYIYLYKTNIEEIENCVRPQNVTFNVTLDTTFVTIVDTASEHTQWDYIYDSSDFDPDTRAYTSVTEKSFKITGLQAHTDYVLYVRTNCGSETSSWAKYTFRTPCSTMTLPYFEGFESLNVTSDVANECYTFYSPNPTNPDCFSGSGYPRIGLVTTSSSKYKSANSSKGVMYYSSDTYHLYLYLPEFDVPVNSTVLDFKYVNEGIDPFYNSNIVVGIMLPNNELSFIPVYTCPIEATSVDNNPVQVDFTQELTGNYPGYRIAFRYGIVYENYYAAIDDISVIAKLKCYNTPEVSITNISSTQVLFDVDYYADSLEVAYGVTGTDPQNCTSFYTTMSSVLIDELLEGTNYDIYVRNVCSGTADSWVGPITLSTECAPISVTPESPWVENFDNTDINIRFPDCMHRPITKENGGITYPIVIDTVNITAPSALAMKGENMVVLPRFTGNVTDYTLSFYASGNGVVTIGCVNGAVAASFSTATTINIVAGITKYEVDLSMFNMSGNRIALQTAGSSSVFIDSLTVSNRPTCFDPRFVNAQAISDNSAEIACQLSSITTSYEYYLAQGTDTLVSTTMSGTTNLIPLTSLAASTTYTFGIRTTCSDGEVSDWVTTSFTTNVPMLRAPIVLDFEGSADEDAIIFKPDADNIFVIGTASDAVRSGAKAMYVTNNTAAKTYEYTTGSSKVSYALIPAYLEAGAYSISFDWKCRGEIYYDYGRVFLAPINTSILGGTNSGFGLSTVPDGCIAIDGGYSLVSSNSNWNNSSIDLVLNESKAYYVVISWINDGGGGTQPPLSIDNLNISKFDCVDKLSSVVTSDEAVNSFNMTVTNNPLLHDSIHYFIMDPSGAVVAADTVYNVISSVVIPITGLNENTTYAYNVGGFCNNGSTPYLKGYVTTKCGNVVVNQTVGLEAGFEGFANGVSLSDADPCWGMDGHEITTLPTWNTGCTPYSGTQALNLREEKTTTIYRNCSVAAGDYQFMVFANSTTPNGKIALMTRAMGSTAWDTLRVQNVGSVYEPIVAKVTLTEGIYDIGVYINSQACIYGYVMIDDISLKAVSAYTPSNLQVTNITDNSADISWIGYSDSHRVRLYDANNDVVIDTVMTNGNTNITVTGLTSSSNYQVKVNSIAADGVTTSIEISKNFVTTCVAAYSYFNDFESEVSLTRPTCWQFESYKYSGEPYEVTSSPHWSVWELNTNKVIAIYPWEIQSNAVSYLYSPEIVIDQAKQLSFDYLNNLNTSRPDSLIVSIVSNNVESSPILVATNQSTGGNWQVFNYDLSSYIGSTIRVKFTHRSSYNGSEKYIAIDNFKVNCLDSGAVYNTTVCNNEGFVGYGFNVTASQLSVGQTTTFTREVAGLNGDCDTLVTLNVYVQLAQTIQLYDTICEGDVYNNGRFVNLTTTGNYQQVYPSYAGCDSIVYLYLTVLPVYHNVTVNLCEGDTYNFAGQTITAAGVYSDTITRSNGCDSIVSLTVTYSAKYFEETDYFCEGTSYTWAKNGQSYTAAGRYEHNLRNIYGCDSVLVLNLIMLPTNTYLTAELCQGQSYEFFGNTITEAGNYTHRLANSLGCDSIINLTVTTTAAPITRVSDYVCEGQDYYGNGFTLTGIVSDTVVTNTVKTLEGCDSIVELTLDFIPTAHVAITATINEGETYEFGGNSLSQAGEYTHTYHTALGCDSIVTLTLIVTTPVDNAYALPIIVAPNPVVGGQSTFVNREWTAEEQNGMRVEVLNAVGQVVDIFTPATFPIEVGGIYTSGVYYIRVTSGTGEVYLGRLVVK